MIESEQWSEEPLERRDLYSLAAPHGFTWRSKTIKYVSFKHSVNRESKKHKTVPWRKDKWTGSTAREKAS